MNCFSFIFVFFCVTGRDEIHVGFLNALRTLRTSCIEVLTQFFDRFEAYPWRVSEIDTVLRVFVHPIVDRLPHEGIHSPTALMKLFTVWSQHPRYGLNFIYVIGL